MKSYKGLWYILIVVLIICAYLYISMLADLTQPAEAHEMHILYFPIVYIGLRPVRAGCEPPDGAPCTHGPPFITVNLP